MPRRELSSRCGTGKGVPAVKWLGRFARGCATRRCFEGAVRTCRAGPGTDYGAAATNADFGFSGNWYDPATSGQGVTVDVDPGSRVLFLAWYNYPPNGPRAGPAGQYMKRDRLRLRGPSGAHDAFLLAATARNLRRMAMCLCPAEPRTARMANWTGSATGPAGAGPGLTADGLLPASGYGL